MKHHVCRACGLRTTDPDAHFYKASAGSYKRVCKSCYNTATKARVEAARSTPPTPKPCLDCGIEPRHKTYARCQSCQRAFWRTYEHGGTTGYSAASTRPRTPKAPAVKSKRAALTLLPPAPADTSDIRGYVPRTPRAVRLRVLLDMLAWARHEGVLVEDES